jgi:hypothetical protein
VYVKLFSDSRSNGSVARLVCVVGCDAFPAISAIAEGYDAYAAVMRPEFGFETRYIPACNGSSTHDRTPHEYCCLNHWYCIGCDHE